MKLLIVTNYLGNKGGLGRYSSEVVKATEQLPIDFGIATESKTPSSFREDCILKPVFNRSKIKVVFNILSNLIALRRKAKGYDIIHAHDGWPYGFYAYFAILGTRKKLFITGVGTYSVAPLKKKIIGFFIRKAYRRASNIFCISDFVKKEIDKECPGVNTTVVLMGATKLPEISGVQIQHLKKQFGIDDSKDYPIVLTVGDVKKRKGQLDTLKSLNNLKNEYPSFRYIMIGNGDDKYYVNQINDFAKDNKLFNNIKMISNLYDDSILSFFYSICHLFMLNSNNENDHFEGFGLVMLEAAQFGKPVIGSKGCGIENAMQDCYNGFLTEQGNHKDISQKISKVLNEQNVVFSKNSKEFYTRFSWIKTVGQYYESYLK